MKRLTALLLAALMVAGAASLLTVRARAQQAGVTDDNLAEAIANAKTPADHEAIAEYYDREAAQAESRAKAHRAMAKFYEKFHLKPADMGPHCNALADAYDKAAAEATALAADHRAMEKTATAP